MQLFVTGLCGHLGRALAAECAARGDRVVGIDVAPWPRRTPMPPNVTLVRAGLDDRRTLRSALAGCDGLVHAAAMHLVNGRGRGMTEFLHVNVECTRRLLEMAVCAGVQRIALCSSMTVMQGGRPPFLASGRKLLHERLPPRADHPYPISKLRMENLGRAITAEYGVSVASLRFMAFGSERGETGPNLLTWRVSVRDAARACLLALARDDLRGEVFHIGSGTPLTNRLLNLADRDPDGALEQLYPGAVAVLRAVGRPLRPKHFGAVADSSKARRWLGYRPEETFEKWLRTQGWKRAHISRETPPRSTRGSKRV